MNAFMRKLFTLALFYSCLAGVVPPAQGSELWRELNPAQPDSMRRAVSGKRLFIVNMSELRKVLRNAPHEIKRDRSHLITLPMPDGSLSRFEIIESPIMEAELAAKFPQIKTFKVNGVDDPLASGRVDLTVRGFSGMLNTSLGRVFIDPDYGSDINDSYISRNDTDRMRSGFSCAVGEHDLSQHEDNTADMRGAQRVPGMLLEYRLAVAATREYVVALGGTVELAQAGIVTTINRVNQIFEDDLGIRLTLIANNDQLIENNGNVFFSNNDNFALLSENQAWTDSQIGINNYDLGHVFGTGGGGVAQLRSTCNPSAKAHGVSSLPNPVGDPFHVDFVAHEIGHQFGAEHTFNGTTQSCASNRNPGTAFEPGSGSTIMAYSSICGNENLQINSDAIFHAGSIAQIDSFTGGAGNCGTLIPTSPAGNNDPIIDNLSDRIIPIQTPFELDASANDADPASSLSYQWDQMSIGSSTNAATFGSDLADNPLFRSFIPRASSPRNFPALGTQILGRFDDAEVMPCSARTLDFRLTVRDGNGGQDTEDLQVSIDASSGPFRITNFTNRETIIVVNNSAILNWDVSNTNNAPISCGNVDIELLTFEDSAYSSYSIHTLMENVPNDGNQLISFPDSSLSHPRARLRLKCSNNVFYDISDADLVISGTDPTPLNYTDNDRGTFFNNNGTVGLTPPPCFLPGNLQLSGSMFDINENSGIVTITINRAGGSDGAASALYTTSDGTAIAGQDYVVSSGMINFADGETSRSFDITLIDDSQTEPSETFVITLSSVTGASLGNISSATVTINDDDLIPPQPAVIQFSEAAYTIGEADGMLQIDVIRSGDTSAPAMARYSIHGASAIAGVDFISSAGALFFAVGQTAGSISISINDDAIDEVDETFFIALNEVTGATKGPLDNAVITILDDDIESGSEESRSSSGGSFPAMLSITLVIFGLLKYRRRNRIPREE